MGFDIYKRKKDNKYYYRLYAGNRQIIFVSNAYSTKREVLHVIDKVRRNAKEDNFKVKQNRNGEWFFILKSEQGETIGKSEEYWSKQAMDNGIRSVKLNVNEEVNDKGLLDVDEEGNHR